MNSAGAQAKIEAEAAAEPTSVQVHEELQHTAVGGIGAAAALQAAVESAEQGAGCGAAQLVAAWRRRQHPGTKAAAGIGTKGEVDVQGTLLAVEEADAGNAAVK